MILSSFTPSPDSVMLASGLLLIPAEQSKVSDETPIFKPSRPLRPVGLKELSISKVSTSLWSPPKGIRSLTPATAAKVIKQEFVDYAHDLKNILLPFIHVDVQDQNSTALAQILQGLDCPLEPFYKRLNALSLPSETLYAQLFDLQNSVAKVTKEEIEGLVQGHFKILSELATNYETLLSSLPKEVKSKDLDGIRAELERGKSMSNESYEIAVPLTFSEHIESIRHSICRKCLNLNTSAASEGAAAVKENQEITLIIKTDPQLNGMFLSSIESNPTKFANKIKQIIVNLAGNASKYTTGDLIEINVKLRNVPGRQVGDLEISVSDNGVGFFRNFDGIESAEQANQKAKIILTGLNTQGDAASSSTGNGIGGSIVNNLVSWLKGELNVQTLYINPQGVKEGFPGANVSVTIPNVGNEEMFNKPLSIEEEGQTPLRRTPAEQLRNLQERSFEIIVVDDSAINTTVLEKVFNTKIAMGNPLLSIRKFNNKTPDPRSQGKFLDRGSALDSIIARIKELVEIKPVIMVLDGDLNNIPVGEDSRYSEGFNDLVIIQAISKVFNGYIGSRIKFVSYSADGQESFPLSPHHLKEQPYHARLGKPLNIEKLISVLGEVVN